MNATELAAKSVQQLADQLGIKLPVDPALVVHLGGMLADVLLAPDPWAAAAKHGLARAALVKDVASAEAAAVERNR